MSDLKNNTASALAGLDAALIGRTTKSAATPEREAAEQEMARRFADMHMPEDIRARARAWRMEAFLELLWNRAFQAGYREGLRDRMGGADE